MPFRFLAHCLVIAQLSTPFHGLNAQGTPGRFVGMYSFYDPSIRGAFDTSKEQLRLAIDAFTSRGAQGLVDRLKFFPEEDQRFLLRALGTLRSNIPIEFRENEILIGGHQITADTKGDWSEAIFLNQMKFAYDVSLSLEDNAKIAEKLLSKQVTMIDRILRELSPLPVAQASAGAAIVGILVALFGGLYLLNRNKDPYNATEANNGHKSLGARFSGMRNYLSTAFNKPAQGTIEEALASARKHRASYTNSRYMILVDYANCRNQNSFFVLDLKTGSAVRSYRIPTAYGSTDSRKLCTHSCSDRPGSGQFEGGAMVTTGSWGAGSKTGEGISLRGLEARNRNTFNREIKIHEGNYKDWGNSAGCFVLSRNEIEDLKSYVGPGTFVYAANCPNQT